MDSLARINDLERRGNILCFKDDNWIAMWMLESPPDNWQLRINNFMLTRAAATALNNFILEGPRECEYEIVSHVPFEPDYVVSTYEPLYPRMGMSCLSTASTASPCKGDKDGR